MAPIKPKTRLDCPDHPCPWVSCQYHLLFAITTNYQELTNEEYLSRLFDMPATCMLNLIDDNPDGMTLDQIAYVLGGTLQNIDQVIERKNRRHPDKPNNGAIPKMRKNWKRMEL